MGELPNVAPVQGRLLSRSDLTAVLTGLAPGWYLSRDLLPRTNVWLKSQGRDSITAHALGNALHRVMMLERRNVHGNVRAFRITPAAVEGRDWFVETQPSETDPRS